MSYRIAGIDVHKKMLAVVVSDVEIERVPVRAADAWQQPRWNGIGSRYARSEKGQGGGRERCIWQKRSPIAGREGARGISAMPNV